jgi:hypothetical protein
LALLPARRVNFCYAHYLIVLFSGAPTRSRLHPRIKGRLWVRLQKQIDLKLADFTVTVLSVRLTPKAHTPRNTGNHAFKMLS